MFKEIFKLVMPLMALTTMSLSADQVFDPSSAIIYDTNPCCPEIICCEEPSGTFFIAGDLLYWTTRTSGLDSGFGTASINQEINDCVLITDSRERDSDPHFDWKPGFRITAGFQSACKTWELAAIWTNFKPHGSRSGHQNCDVTNRGRYSLQYDQVDLLALYNISTCSFTLRPYLGVRGTRIDSKLRADITTDISLPGAVLATEDMFFHDKQDYRGIGPVLGIKGDYEIGGGFGIYGNAAGSVLYGNYKINYHDEDIFSAPISNEIYSSIKKHLHLFNCNIDLGVGVCYNLSFCDSFQLCMKLGFEHHQYFNQNRMGSSCGDLSFDGGIFSVCLAY